MSLDLPLDWLTPLSLDDSLALPNGHTHCSMLLIVDFSDVRLLVRVEPWAFLVHLQLKLLCLSLDLRDLHLCQVLRRLLLTLLVVPQQPVLVRGVFQHYGVEMHGFLMGFMRWYCYCCRLRVDHFLNLTLFPFEFCVVKMVDSGRNLLSLSEFGNHIEEESPASYFLLTFFVYEFNLVGVAKVRLGVGKTLDPFTQFLLVVLGSFFQDFFDLLVVKDLFMLLNLLLRLFFVKESLGRSMMFKIWTVIVMKSWVNFIFEIFNI